MAKNPQVPPAGWPALPAKEQVGFLLKALQHTLRQNLDQALRKQGVELSFAHLACLFNLHYHPGISGAQIARRAMVSAQTMNSALHALEHDGLIERRPHPDSRRADSWSLTEAGLEALASAREVGTAIFGRMLGPLKEDEVEAFADYLRRCLRALDGGAEVLDSPSPSLDEGVRAPPQRRQKAGVSSTRNV
jgi:DNA-binding MarR family transcriptional regulator